MCGIIGFIGKIKANEIVLDGLKHLEYRGYDSCGVSMITLSDIIVKKDVGKIDEVHARLNFLEPASNIIISHTRWATHGGITTYNAHPHLDCKKEITVVHNGIIENYKEIKKYLIEKGHKFKSETDTEVVPHLIEEEINKGKKFEEACASIIKKIRGSSALVIGKKGVEKIIGIKIGSPLVVGVSEFGNFIASDIPAFLKYTKNVIFVKDYEMVIASKDKVRVYEVLKNGRIKKVKKKVYTIDWNVEKAEKGSFQHFMIKEILEQVDAIKLASMQDREKLESFAENIKNYKNLFFLGAGSSYHASLVGKYLFSKIAKTTVVPILASEFIHYKDLINDESLIIAISQSGETYDVLEAVKFAKKVGAKILSIVNVNGSSLTWESDDYLLMNVGPEIGVAATKTYTAEIVILSLISYALSKRLEEGKKRLEYLQNIIYNLTAENRRKEIEGIARFLKDKKSIFVIGRGILYPTAMEGALKIKEISYIHAEAFAGGELKHGTLSLIEKGVPAIVLVDEETKDSILSNAHEIKTREGVIIGVSPFYNEIFDYFIKVPECGYENAVSHVIPLQLLSYYIAVSKGLDPDKPRNLAKSITVK
ncbi:MAG: glutamine--fructose-6-phosphate transaminase (isomerizing) [Candidatus Aenigmarchaeota archaeon]|nr:glutamine--fructose-6-phosphate transaminase (isomerizing) [Candidatus Aenigmarchaeota archaeon]MDW8149615.1 glutamine--fructose-6-phosphate transaminase (isomerizing) [Candidatus Aenigmarchaeota archaeon]